MTHDEYETLIHKLKEEIKRLKANKPRKLIDDITNKDMLSIFSYRAIDGKVVKDIYNTDNNFNTFVTNVLRVLYPVQREKKDGHEYLSYRNINEVPQEIYDIYIDTIDKCIEIIYNNINKISEVV